MKYYIVWVQTKARINKGILINMSDCIFSNFNVVVTKVVDHGDYKASNQFISFHESEVN